MSRPQQQAKGIALFPMDPRRMASLLNQYGIKTKELRVKRVVMETEEGELVIEKPEVIEVSMQGNLTFYQISGKPVKRENQEKEKVEEITEEDIKLVMESAGVDREKALEALKACKGDIAAAILYLENK